MTHRWLEEIFAFVRYMWILHLFSFCYVFLVLLLDFHFGVLVYFEPALFHWTFPQCFHVHFLSKGKCFIQLNVFTVYNGVHFSFERNLLQIYTHNTHTQLIKPITNTFTQQTFCYLPSSRWTNSLRQTVRPKETTNSDRNDRPAHLKQTKLSARLETSYFKLKPNTIYRFSHPISPSNSIYCFDASILSWCIRGKTFLLLQKLFKLKTTLLKSNFGVVSYSTALVSIGCERILVVFSFGMCRIPCWILRMGIL